MKGILELLNGRGGVILAGSGGVAVGLAGNVAYLTLSGIPWEFLVPTDLALVFGLFSLITGLVG